ncbi:MAG: M24 family metallopeptidase [Chitinophagales bacterium]|nr:M24 family metallopeptidase [Chitinophagales bacterium]
MARYNSIDPQLFIENRKHFASKLKENSIAVFHSSDLMPISADAHHPFHQNPDLFWLTGLDQEEIYLIIYPDCEEEKYTEALFIKRTSELIAIWEGAKYNLEEAAKISGIETVLWYDQFDSIFTKCMHRAENVYINLNEHDRMENAVPYWDLRFSRKLMHKFPLHNYNRSAPILRDLRAIKSSVEIELIKRACDITEAGFRRVLNFVKPGVMEYEIEAEITHEFIRSGSKGHAYEPIIASGRDSCVLHYVANDKACSAGDVLLMDFGSRYANYASDLSRTIPVSGKFTQRQRDVYNAVLRVMREATDMLTSGTHLIEYEKEVGKIMESELVGLGLLDRNDIEKQDPKKPAYKKYFMHGTSHFLGLDVHDVGDKYLALTYGNVLTCEPGIYILEESIGVRIENDILVSEDGPVDLMANIPIEAEEIEEIMNSSLIHAD